MEKYNIADLTKMKELPDDVNEHPIGYAAKVGGAAVERLKYFEKQRLFGSVAVERGNLGLVFQFQRGVITNFHMVEIRDLGNGVTDREDRNIINKNVSVKKKPT